MPSFNKPFCNLFVAKTGTILSWGFELNLPNFIKLYFFCAFIFHGFMPVLMPNFLKKAIFIFQNKNKVLACIKKKLYICIRYLITKQLTNKIAK